MPKAKKSSKRKKFDYNKDRKKMMKQAIKKCNPRIENKQVRNAWDDKKSMARNLQEMGLAFDPNRTLPIKKSSLLGKDPVPSAPVGIVTKPYVLNQLQLEADCPGKDSKTLSSDLIEYTQYMIREHADDFKAMANDEKNYYQDTPKQIRRKINEYKRCHPEHYSSFLAALVASLTEPQTQPETLTEPQTMTETEPLMETQTMTETEPLTEPQTMTETEPLMETQTAIQ